MTPLPAQADAPLPTSSYDAFRLLDAQYSAQLQSGSFQPFLYPWDTLGTGIVILYLLLDHRQSQFLRSLRIPAWLLNVYFSLYTVLYHRGQNPASSLGLGIIQGWSILWTGTLIVLDDCQSTYARIEDVGRPGSSTLGFKSTPASEASMSRISRDESIDGTKSTEVDGNLIRQRFPESKPGKSTKEVTSDTRRYFWQQYPSGSLFARLDWVLDILTSFRGGAWNWRISNLPTPPPQIQDQLSSAQPPPYQPSKPSRTQLHALSTVDAVIQRNLYLVVRNYIFLDLTKTLMSHDPYFWGYVSPSVVPGYLPTSLQTFQIIRICRLFICLSAMKHSLEQIFALGPLFFIFLGPKVVGLRTQPWLYPDQFGSLTSVLDKGLAGFWGAFWHQTFRKGFETPGNKLVSIFGLEQRGSKAKAVKLFVAFGLSGFLHACGSHTQMGKSMPFEGPMAFFLSQAVGICVEMGIKAWLKKRGVPESMPYWITAAGNLGFVLVWLYFTGPLMMDDFARGGLWLYEPIPISIFRGPLRLGSADDRWWRWTGHIVRWHTGDTWWRTGLAL